MLDTGGGLGIAYGLPDEPSTIKDYGKVVVDGIKEECEKHGLTVPAMAVEPGRSIVANAGVTLYTVGSIKEIPNIRTYVAVDGGMSDNIRTSLYDAHYEALIANKADQPREMVATVAGKHCESGDIVVNDAPLQCPEVGDILCVCATGAYCQSMSSNYNKQVRPGVVFVQRRRVALGRPPRDLRRPHEVRGRLGARPRREVGASRLQWSPAAARHVGQHDVEESSCAPSESA